MNHRKNGQPQAHAANQLHCQRMRKPQPHQPLVLQPKMAMPSQMKKPPVAPPVYCPQNGLRTVQPQMGSETQVKKQAAAPPAYRPQPVPRVLQGKSPSAPQQSNQSHHAPVAPPVYSPNALPRVLQKKESAHSSRQATPAVQQIAPPAHQRQTPKPLEQKLAANQSNGNLIGQQTRHLPPHAPGINHARFAPTPQVSVVVQRKPQVSSGAKPVNGDPRSSRASQVVQRHQAVSRTRSSVIQCELDETEKETLYNWLKTQRSRQFNLVSPGVIAYIVEEVSGDLNLDAAKLRAGEILNEVAKIEQFVPLPVEEANLRTIPHRMIEKKSQLERLIEAQQSIEASEFLTRRIAQVEADIFTNRSRIGDPVYVFPEGVEGAKAFAIDRTFKFGNASRNKRAEDYAYMLKIRLTRSLKDYLIKHLWINVYKVDGKNYKSNPQIKYENSGYTVIIPYDAWRAFWQRVETFEIFSEKTREATYTSRDLHDDMHRQWHQQQLTLFNQNLPDNGERPSYIN